jgi:hypothetical protein
MKNIIAITLIMCTSIVNAQLTVSSFNNSDDLMNKQITGESSKWIVNDNNTPDVSSDDMLQQFIYDANGEFKIHREGSIQSTVINTNGTFTMQVIDEYDQWYNVVFWTQYKGGPAPLVAYEYSDGYVLFTGNIEY